MLLVIVLVAVFASGLARYLNLDALQTHEPALRAFVSDNLFLALATFVAADAYDRAPSDLRRDRQRPRRPVVHPGLGS